MGLKNRKRRLISRHYFGKGHNRFTHQKDPVLL